MADIITTRYDTGIWTVRGNTWTKIFEDQVFVLAWGTPTKVHSRDHAVAVAGRCEDGSVDIHAGANGEFGDVVDAAINLKDRYHLFRGYCEPDPQGLVLASRRQDGLCAYEKLPSKITNAPKYRHPPEHWPYFVGYDHVANLAMLPEDKVRDIESIITQLEELAHKGLVRFARRKWPALYEALGRDRATMAEKAVVRAAAHAVDRVLKNTTSIHSPNSPTYRQLTKRVKK
jgi:hypothetical protein